jgi:HrpA-like RNA helicase
MAEECGVQLGQRVGHSVGFDDMTSGSTRIKYMTYGILLRYYSFFLILDRDCMEVFFVGDY